MSAPERDGAPFADGRAFVEADARRIAGLLIATIAFLVAAFVGWMAWATVEEVVRAQGRVEPAGQVKLVNHARGGKVVELLVEEGQRVEAGAPLLKLDAAIILSEYEELSGRLQVRRAEIARLESEAHALALSMPPDLLASRPDLVEAQTQLKEARAAAIAAQRGTLEQTIEARRGDLAMAAAERDKAGTGLGFLDEQLGSIRELAARGLYPRLRLIAAEKERADARAERREAEAKLAAAVAGLAEAEHRLAGLETTWRADILGELAEARADRDRLSDQLTARQAHLDSLAVTAPVTGVVLDLAVTALGQSVAPHETVLRIVPEGETLTVEARVRNEDIGRVELGMQATVKVLAYDYLRHGSLAGEVVRIAADASSDRPDAPPTYLVRIVTDREQLGPERGDRAVVPGMLVDVELKAGERTILSYLTDRILRLRDSAFREG
jgi:membrane fusion protein, adhesin transport system